MITRCFSSLAQPLPIQNAGKFQRFARKPSASLPTRQEASPNLLLRDPSQPLSYHIHRTASQQLPVYQHAKRGGNLKQTRVRKIDGSLLDLRNDLQVALGLAKEQVAINQLTRHIIVKGWRQKDIVKFFQELRF